MINGHIITTEDFFYLSRATSLHLDESEVMAFIDEVEQIYIIPAIGYPLYEYLTQPNTKQPSDLNNDFNREIFLHGGTYTTCTCGEDERKYFKGIKAATAYYAYAKMARSDGSIITRAGYVHHRDDYSDHFDDSKLKQYNDVMDIAEVYLSRCVEYLNTCKVDTCCNKKQIKPTRSKIKAIGK